MQAEQDRQRSERNLADTEFLAREMAALRIALSEVATRDFVRSELRNLLEDLDGGARRPSRRSARRPPERGRKAPPGLTSARRPTMGAHARPHRPAARCDP